MGGCRARGEGAACGTRGGICARRLRHLTSAMEAHVAGTRSTWDAGARSDSGCRQPLHVVCVAPVHQCATRTPWLRLRLRACVVFGACIFRCCGASLWASLRQPPMRPLLRVRPHACVQRLSRYAGRTPPQLISVGVLAVYPCVVRIAKGCVAIAVGVKSSDAPPILRGVVARPMHVAPGSGVPARATY